MHNSLSVLFGLVLILSFSNCFVHSFLKLTSPNRICRFECLAARSTPFNKDFPYRPTKVVAEKSEQNSKAKWFRWISAISVFASVLLPFGISDNLSLKSNTAQAADTGYNFS